MYFLDETKKEWNVYKKMLQDICSLSNLFSDSAVPYLYYRAHENIFCRAFDAENLSREDCSADARKDKIGIGLKTFLNAKTEVTFQKIAEFNKERKNYEMLLNMDNADELALKISELRNKRVEFTMRNHSLDKMIYHCVAREEGMLKVFEESMDFIDTDSIRVTKTTPAGVAFSDGKHDYNFNRSKSTLFKKFKTQNCNLIPVKIVDDPFKLISGIISEEYEAAYRRTEESIILPLYSTKRNSMALKSGLNQWNAGGRERDFDECYIPIPSFIRKHFSEFFPSKDEPFTLLLPNREKLNVKICQAGGKALMSNPNSALGKWLLRGVFSLKKGELLTDEILETVGVDSVEIIKTGEKEYRIDFMPTGSYSDFEKNIEPDA